MSRLQPWVRWTQAGRTVLARPDASLPAWRWARILWEAEFQREPLHFHATHLHKAEESQWWLSLAGETEPAFGAIALDCIDCPAARLLAETWRYPHRPGGGPVVGLVRRRLWPLGLLYEMARAGCALQPDVPPPNCPSWVGGLSVRAAIWYGPEFGVKVFNSLILATSRREAKLRWELAFAHPPLAIRPAEATPVPVLSRLEEVIRTSHPAMAPLWGFLTGDDADGWDGLLQVLWREDFSREDQLEECLQWDGDLQEVALTAPHRLREYLQLRQLWRPFEQLLPEVGDGWSELFLSHPDFSARLLVLLCLGQLGQSRPDPLLELAARRFEGVGGVRLLGAIARWKEFQQVPAPDPNVLQELGVQEESLRRLAHWRGLAGMEPWPKSLRRWLERDSRRQRELMFLEAGPAGVRWGEKRLRRLQKPSTDQQDLRKLLRLQQNLDQSLRCAGTQAWQRLLEDCLRQLLADFVGLPASQLEGCDLEVGWLLGNVRIDKNRLRMALRPAATLRELPANRFWLDRQAPKGFRAEPWLAGHDHFLIWQGRRYRMATADFRESLKMGTHFATCLSLRMGMYSQAALFHSLDVNKMVIYLRDERGRPIFRQLVAVDQSGQLVTYPVYQQPGYRALLPLWFRSLENFAARCGLLLNHQAGRVLSLHASEKHSYLDYPEPKDGQTQAWEDEDHFWQHPLELRAGCQRSWLREVMRVLARRPVKPSAFAMRVLARLGQTGWLGSLRPIRLGGQFLSSLSYDALPGPLVPHLLQGLSGHISLLPVALGRLPFDMLLAVIGGLWQHLQDEPRLWMQALTLMVVSWTARPDGRALWRHFKALRPLTSWFCEFNLVPDMRLPGRAEVSMGLKSDLMNDLIQGLKGDQQAMERWALAKDSSWRMELVAMLHQAGRLRWPPEKLLDGLALAAPGTVACRDQQWLAGRPCEWPNWTEWCLDLKRSRLWQAAWHHLPTFSMSERVELTLIAFTRVGPEAWDRLAAWLPCRQEVPDHLWQRLQAMACTTRRLKAWMEAIARQTDS